MFLSNFLIALREGVEASLIVGILVAYLVKANRREVLPKMWVGVVLATVIPLSLGAYMTWGPYTLDFQAQEAIGGGLSIVAAGFITWMLFWMASHAHSLSKDVKNQAAAALSKGSAWGVVWLAIISVGREGIETAVFIWATVKSAADTSVLDPALGMLCGILGAIVIGYLIYTGAARIDLRLFFKVTGLLLIIVAAGIVSYGIGDLQEAGIIPGHGLHLYDFTGYFDNPAHPWLSTSSWWFVLLEAMFNVNLSPSYLQFAGWVIYLAICLPLFFVQYRRARKAANDKLSKTQVANLQLSQV